MKIIDCLSAKLERKKAAVTPYCRLVRATNKQRLPNECFMRFIKIMVDHDALILGREQTSTQKYFPKTKLPLELAEGHIRLLRTKVMFAVYFCFWFVTKCKSVHNQVTPIAAKCCERTPQLLTLLNCKRLKSDSTCALLTYCTLKL